MSLLEDDWLSECAMKRVICHWTAGKYEASGLDREHYHFLIEKDGRVVRGRFSIQDNVSTADGAYAAHTRGCNTGAIGVAVCCMADAAEAPFVAGSCPMLETQWRAMAMVVAELCRRYDIDVTPQTVLGHGEVEKNLGIKQKGKWDPLALPWNRSRTHEQAGEDFRALVRQALAGRPAKGGSPSEALRS